jgi:type VI secretion system protein ImpL
MRPVTRLRLFILLGLVVWLVLSWFVGTRLGGGHPWLLLLLLALVGLLTAGFLVWYYRAPAVADDARRAEESIDQTLREAGRRLRASQSRSGRRMRNVPMIIVLGPTGAAKTTTVLSGGGAPELLAGSVHRGDVVVPTAGANAWLSDSTVIIEAGGSVLESPAAWKRLLRHLPAGRWRAALTGRPQATRLALVCLSCEDIHQPGAAEKMAAHARALRERLLELSGALRVRLPVYVLFTKLDRVPFFAEYVRPLTAEEVREAFGALLPVDVPGGAGWAEQMHRRVTEALNALFSSLAARRLLVLGRDAGGVQAANAYEFPRELRTLFAPITEFLLELGKPSQLHAAPFIRGVHFAGVRAVLAADGAAPGAAARRVPQWVFLDRFFPKVVLADETARGVTRSGHGVYVLRRALLVTAMLIAVVASMGMIVSALGNHDLAEQAARLARGGSSLEAAVDGVPSTASLAKLDSLRELTATISRQARGARPLRLRWGMSQATALYPLVRRAYFRAFERLLFDGTRSSLRAGLRNLPASPTEELDYGKVYDRLKAYLIVVRNNDKSTARFLGPVLYAAWSEGRGAMEADRAALTKAQFDFFGEELAWGNPYTAAEDTTAIRQGRTYLSQFAGAGSSRILQTIVDGASRAESSVVFARLAPAGGAVTATYEVPGAYTKRGWEFMQKAFTGKIDEYLKAEAWVVGDDAAPPPERGRLVRELQAQYRLQYAREWRDFLKSASVARYGSPKEAASRLSVLGSNQSPLLVLFGVTTLHTGVDSSISQLFSSVHLMAPPYGVGALVNAGNEPYVTALVQLQSSVNQVANGPPESQQSAAQGALAKAGEARSAAQQLASKFFADSLQVHANVQRLMLAPIEGVEDVFRNLGSRNANEAAARFCATLRPVMGRFPFSWQSREKATMADVVAAFGPQQGTIWSFAREQLQNQVTRQGASIVARPGAGPPLTPAALDFFRKAAEVTDALFQANGEEPHFVIALRPELSAAVPAVRVDIDGVSQTFTRTSNSYKTYDWYGNRAQSVQLSVPAAGEAQDLSFRGPWALFDLFHQAEFRDAGANWRAEFAKPKVALELNLRGVAPIFRRDYFAQWKCPSPMVK